MRIWTSLGAQHTGWMFKKHWKSQGSRVASKAISCDPISSNLIEIKAKFNDGVQCIREQIPVAPQNEFYLYNNFSVLLGGVHQALDLTNAIEINQMPKNIKNNLKNLKLPNNIKEIVNNITLSSHSKNPEKNIFQHRNFTINDALSRLNASESKKYL